MFITLILLLAPFSLCAAIFTYFFPRNNVTIGWSPLKRQRRRYGTRFYLNLSMTCCLMWLLTLDFTGIKGFALLAAIIICSWRTYSYGKTLVSGWIPTKEHYNYVYEKAMSGAPGMSEEFDKYAKLAREAKPTGEEDANTFIIKTRKMNECLKMCSQHLYEEDDYISASTAKEQPVPQAAEQQTKNDASSSTEEQSQTNSVETTATTDGVSTESTTEEPTATEAGQSTAPTVEAPETQQTEEPRQPRKKKKRRKADDASSTKKSE